MRQFSPADIRDAAHQVGVATLSAVFRMQCRWPWRSAFGELGSGVPGSRLEWGRARP